MSKRASEMSQHEQMNLQNEIYLICEHPPLFAAFCSPFLGTTTNKNAQVTQRMSRCFVGSSSAVSACFPSWAQRRIRLLAARRVWCGLKRGAVIYGSSTKPPIRTYAPPTGLGKVRWGGWLIGQPSFLATESQVWPF